MTEPAYDRRRLAAMLDEQSEWMSVRVASELPGPEWISCEALLGAQLDGQDPTAQWRQTLQDAYGAQYGIEPPRQVAAMFVLMWYVGVPVHVATVSGALTGCSPDVSPAALAFRLHPTQHFPEEIALLPGPVLPMQQAAAAASAHCRAFVDSYSCGVKLGSRQRYGAIADDIRARLAAAATLGAPYAPRPPAPSTPT